MGKKGDLSDFEHGMVVGARRAGLSISKTADRLGLSRTTISRVYREWSEKEKIFSEWQMCRRKCFVDVLRAAERKLHKSKDPSDLSIYQSLLSYFSAEVHTAKASYFHNKINSTSDTRNLFKTLNSLLCPSNFSSPATLHQIPSHLLQAISPSLLPALTHIINISLLTGTCTTAFKQARVTPLH